jgi:beta-glucanase (GH16 family)
MGDLADAAVEIEHDIASLDKDVSELALRVASLERQLDVTTENTASALSRIMALEARVWALENPASPPPLAPAPGWELVWSDEFDNPSGWPDPTKWSTGQNSWGGEVNASEHQAWAASQSYVKGGCLRLEAARIPMLGKQYISGIVHTKGKAEWLPPLKVEVRARYPVGNGFWPGLWLLHDEHRKVGTFEIDILEVMGNKPDETYHTYHWYPADFDHKEIDSWRKQPAGFSAEWHTYALEWLPEGVRWLIDDKVTQAIAAIIPTEIVTVPPSGPRTTTTGRPLICDKPMHLIADLSLGGWGGNAPDPTTPLPGALEIDYVRVFRWRE